MRLMMYTLELNAWVKIRRKFPGDACTQEVRESCLEAWWELSCLILQFGGS